MKTLLFLLCAWSSVMKQAQALPSEDTVALIIGGFSNNGDDSTIFPSVEIFGCPNQGSVRVDNFPRGSSSLMGGVYVDSLNAALICGGYSCSSDEVCSTSKQCHQFSSLDHEWTQAEDLLTERFGHIMATGPNLLSGTGEIQHIAVGSNLLSTEIFDGESWNEYLELPTPAGYAWYVVGCMVQHGNLVYSVANTVQVLDLSTWSIKTIGVVPTEPITINQCAYTKINGREGKYIVLLIKHNLKVYVMYKNYVIIKVL